MGLIGFTLGGAMWSVAKVELKRAEDYYRKAEEEFQGSVEEWRKELKETRNELIAEKLEDARKASR